MTIDEIGKQPPPYVSYKTFESFIISLEQQLPTHIDRNHWGEMFSESTGTQLMSASLFLNLIDVKARPMPRLKLLVTTTHGEHRAALLRQIVYESYAFVFKGKLDTQNASYTELEDIFRNTYKMDSVVSRRCIKFFIDFSKEAGIPLSPQLTQECQEPCTCPELINTNMKFDIGMDSYPDGAIPPGKYLKEELEARNISQEEFAGRVGIPLNAINEIIKGKKTITAEMALQFQEVMPTFPARFWLYLQSDFQLSQVLAAKHSDR
jgi:addiction module HigA family antidote